MFLTNFHETKDGKDSGSNGAAIPIPYFFADTVEIVEDS